MYIYFIFGFTQMNCFTALANFGDGSSPQRVLKSVIALFNQLFFTPQQDQQYACPILIYYIITISIFIHYKFCMANLVSLRLPGDLLDISDNTVKYLVVCDHREMAKQLLEAVVCENKNQQIEGQAQDNIIRVQIKNIGTIASITDQVQKVNLLKFLLMRISKMEQDKQSIKKNSEGFFYYNQNIKSICQFKLRQRTGQANKFEKVKAKSCIQIFGILSYMLNYCCSAKQYLSNWIKVFLKNQQFKPELRTHTKVDQFIKRVIQKEIPNPKIAEHQLQIISETVNWIRNKADKTPEKKNKQNKQNLNSEVHFQYSDLMKIDLKKRNDTPARLKHSSSMTSLTSSNKNRKYKKAPQHFKDFKSTKSTFKGEVSKTNESFWHTSKVTPSNSKIFKPATLLACTKKTATDNWYRQDLRQQSMVKISSNIKQINSQEKMVTDELDLLKMLEMKQNKRNATNYQCKSALNDIPKKQNDNHLINLQTINKQHFQKFAICSSNIQICIKPSKKNTNMKICTSLYSLSQNLQFPKITQTNKYTFSEINLSQISNQQGQQQIIKKTNSNQQAKKTKIQQHLQQTNNKQILKQKKQIKNQDILSETQEHVDKNKVFLYEFCAYAYSCRPIITMKKMFISLYSTYLYFIIERNKKQNKQSSFQVKAAKEETNFKNMLNFFNKNKDSVQYSYQTKDDLQFLSKIDVQKIQQTSTIQIQKIRLMILKILKLQFQHLKEDIINNFSVLMEKKTYYQFHIFLLMLAISISLIQNIDKQSDAVSDFPKHKQKIKNKVDINPINLRSELTQYQYLF